MPIFRAAACVAGSLVAIFPLRAQSTPLGETARHSIWLVYAGDHAVSSRVGLVFDTQLRLTQNADHQQQLLLRPGIAFAANRHLKLSAGYTFMGHRVDGNDPLVPRRPEHRAWVSAQLAHEIGPVSLAHRYRAEHRWLPGVEVDDTGARIGETFVTAERMRYSLRASVPLAGRGRARDLTASVSDEVFASFGGYAGDVAVDQNRATISLGARVAPALRMDLGYMLQSAAGDDGRFTERNHVLQIAIGSTAKLR
jgi:hypothetical protein